MKTFYGGVFDWTFEDYGPRYVAIHGAGVEGGFDADTDKKPTRDGALIILYSDNLDASEAAIVGAGGSITLAQFDFPGGRRFHFMDPSGNELAVWTVKSGNL